MITISISVLRDLGVHFFISPPSQHPLRFVDMKNALFHGSFLQGFHLFVISLAQCKGFVFSGDWIRLHFEAKHQTRCVIES